MKIVTLMHGHYFVPDDATHLHGVPIQTLVDHFHAELDWVKFGHGQEVIWTNRNGCKERVTIHKASSAMPNYWIIVDVIGVARHVHEEELQVIDVPGFPQRMEVGA